MSSNIVTFTNLPTADLVVDAVFEGGNSGNTSDDPLSRLLYCGNQGGFRKVGAPKARYVILYSSLTDPDWPDYLDTTTGLFTYYGDNKKPGHTIHDTPQGGNSLLTSVFEKTHAQPAQRSEVPPFFIFTKEPAYGSRAVRFRGLAVPGAPGISSTDDL